MKTQPWGWLAAAVLAAGLNSSYHDGGLGWAHQIVNGVQHNTSAVLALATGRADQFLAEARMLQLDRSLNRAPDAEDPAVNVEVRHCPLAAAVARAQNSFDQSQAEFDGLQALSAREQAKLARLEANRARIEAQIDAKLAGMQFARNRFRFGDDNFSFADTDLTPVVVQVPRIHCPRVHVSMPHIPQVRVQIPRIEAPVVQIDNGNEGPI
jgi:hypothetical protein